MRSGASRLIALGGMMAALAVVIMSLGGLIPIATFVCPMLCMLLLRFVLTLCPQRIGWAWYGAVAILGMLMSPDKEAAAVFAALGYYPILKPRLDKMKYGVVLKFLWFNVVILLMYGVLIYVMGLAQIAAEFAEMGIIMAAVTLVLGNVAFFLMDDLLGRKPKRKFKH